MYNLRMDENTIAHQVLPTMVEATYARNNLSELLDLVISGDTIVITRHGREIAQLVPVSAQAHSPSKTSGQGKLMSKITGEAHESEF